MVMRLLPAHFKNVAVQCREEMLVCYRTVENGVSRRIDLAPLVRIKHFESRRKVVWKNGHQIQE